MPQKQILQSNRKHNTANTRNQDLLNNRKNNAEHFDPLFESGKSVWTVQESVALWHGGCCLESKTLGAPHQSASTSQQPSASLGDHSFTWCVVPIICKTPSSDAMSSHSMYWACPPLAGSSTKQSCCGMKPALCLLESQKSPRVPQ
jgi:hypothetical protein